MDFRIDDLLVCITRVEPIEGNAQQAKCGGTWRADDEQGKHANVDDKCDRARAMLDCNKTCMVTVDFQDVIACIDHTNVQVDSEYPCIGTFPWETPEPSVVEEFRNKILSVRNGCDPIPKPSEIKPQVRQRLIKDLKKAIEALEDVPKDKH